MIKKSDLLLCIMSNFWTVTVLILNLYSLNFDLLLSIISDFWTGNVLILNCYCFNFELLLAIISYFWTITILILNCYSLNFKLSLSIISDFWIITLNFELFIVSLTMLRYNDCIWMREEMWKKFLSLEDLFDVINEKSIANNISVT